VSIKKTIFNYCSAFITLFILMLSVLSFESNAGSQNKINNQLDVETLVRFSKNVERTAAQHGARAFIIARKGRVDADLPKGITYTHTAVAIYSMITTADGKQLPGYAIYNLYQNEGDLGRSSLIVDYPVDFFAASEKLQAGIIIPKPALQQKLVELVHSGDYKSLHNPEYSLIANPFTSQFQNCTEFTLDMINAALYQTVDIKQLKANSKAYFKPQYVAKRLKIKMAAMLTNFVHFDDHQGQLNTATFTTIANYLRQNQLVDHEFTLVP